MKPWYAVGISCAYLRRLQPMVPTLEQSLDVVELAGVVLLPKVFRLLGEVFALREAVSLVRYKVRGDRVELGYERGQVDGWMRRQLVDISTSTKTAYSSRLLSPSETCCLPW